MFYIGLRGTDLFNVIQVPKYNKEVKDALELIHSKLYWSSHVTFVIEGSDMPKHDRLEYDVFSLDEFIIRAFEERDELMGLEEHEEAEKVLEEIRVLEEIQD